MPFATEPARKGAFSDNFSRKSETLTGFRQARCDTTSARQSLHRYCLRTERQQCGLQPQHQFRMTNGSYGPFGEDSMARSASVIPVSCAEPAALMCGKPIACIRRRDAQRVLRCRGRCQRMRERRSNPHSAPDLIGFSENRVHSCVTQYQRFSGCAMSWLLVVLDLSRFDAATLIAFIAAKETNYGNETNGRIPR